MKTSGPEGGTVRTAGILVPPPLVYVAAVLVGFALDKALPSATLPLLARWLGVLLIVVGLALTASFFHAFRHAGTPVDVRKPSLSLVTSGPFRFTRNPAYLSLTLESVGLALVLDAPWALVTVTIAAGIIDRAVIRQERYLHGIFGAEYERYTKRTRRWL